MQRDLFVADVEDVPADDRRKRPEDTLPQPCAGPKEDGRAILSTATGLVIEVADDQTMLIGADPEAGLTLDDPFVSYRHATLRRYRGGFLVEDLHSTNGTYLDGVRISQAWAGPGSRLRIGNHRLDVTTSMVSRTPPSGPMLGVSQVFQVVLANLRRIAPLRQPVLIRGETGTGKELAARELHDRSLRSEGPFVAINCAGISEALAESELFGHLKGAFTGAHRSRTGAFGEADGGTLFLDEVGELPLGLQAKLLRVLEVGHIKPVGSERETPVNVRIVAATHRDLHAMVACGRFREDLVHRLDILTIELPPLRERPDDIPALLRHFAGQMSDELGRSILVSQAAIDAARAHPWPGNIRALRNAVTLAAVLADGPIGPSDLMTGVRTGSCATRAADLNTEGVEVPRGTYRTMKRAMLAKIVEEAGSIRKAAPVLGIPRSTLGTWLKHDE